MLGLVSNIGFEVMIGNIMLFELNHTFRQLPNLCLVFACNPQIVLSVHFIQG
jgi:hypothetical protein